MNDEPEESEQQRRDMIQIAWVLMPVAQPIPRLWHRRGIGLGGDPYRRRVARSTGPLVTVLAAVHRTTRRRIAIKIDPRIRNSFALSGSLSLAFNAISKFFDAARFNETATLCQSISMISLWNRQSSSGVIDEAASQKRGRPRQAASSRVLDEDAGDKASPQTSSAARRPDR